MWMKTETVLEILAQIHQNHILMVTHECDYTQRMSECNRSAQQGKNRTTSQLFENPQSILSPIKKNLQFDCNL